MIPISSPKPPHDIYLPLLFMKEVVLEYVNEFGQVLGDCPFYEVEPS